MRRSLDVLVIGGAGIDDMIRGDALPSPSRSVIGDVFLHDAGGKGLNQAIGAARLDARSALVACVGEDPEGDEVIRALREDRVVTDAIIRVKQVPTARTLICVDAHGRKQTASRPGANAALTEKDLAGDVIAQAAVLAVQLEIPVATVLCAARLAWEAAVRVVLDAGPPADVPDELLRLVEVVTANSEEAKALSHVPVGDRESAFAAARAIRQRGARHVSIGAQQGRAIVGDAGER
jgi:ribokinase